MAVVGRNDKMVGVYSPAKPDNCIPIAYAIVLSPQDLEHEETRFNNFCILFNNKTKNYRKIQDQKVKIDKTITQHQLNGVRHKRIFVKYSDRIQSIGHKIDLCLAL